MTTGGIGLGQYGSLGDSYEDDEDKIDEAREDDEVSNPNRSKTFNESGNGDDEE